MRSGWERLVMVLVEVRKRRNVLSKLPKTAMFTEKNVPKVCHFTINLDAIFRNFAIQNFF